MNKPSTNLTTINSSFANPPVPINEKMAKLLLQYQDTPLSFMRDVIGFEPTSQQEALILSACKDPARVGVKSATATGKTAVLACLALYFCLCWANSRILVTAPTSGQLHRVFRSELIKWHNNMLPEFRELYEVMSTKIYVKGCKDSQFIDLVTGTAENKESFAGLHGDKVVVIVDEASALPDDIFDTLYGTLSFGSTAFILVSNPVRNSGKFYDLFQLHDASPGSISNWELMTFTSYDSPNVDDKWIKETIDYYGKESDFVKMRIDGEFPVVSNAQFFPTDLVNAAIDRTLSPAEYHNFERVLSVDVARFGDDSSVIIDRQGPKLHSIDTYHGVDTAILSNYIVQKFQKGRYSSIFVDGIGVGSGVVDQLKRFQMPVVDVVVSQKSTDPAQYFDMRAQVYGETKKWLETADLPNDLEMRKQMLAIYYSYNKKLQQFMESKKDMKKREGYSPDIIDAIAYSHANAVYHSRYRNVGPRTVIPSNYKYA